MLVKRHRAALQESEQATGEETLQAGTQCADRAEAIVAIQEKWPLPAWGLRS
jgi:hypothetical protein